MSETTKDPMGPHLDKAESHLEGSMTRDTNYHAAIKSIIDALRALPNPALDICQPSPAPSAPAAVRTIGERYAEKFIRLIDSSAINIGFQHYDIKLPAVAGNVLQAAICSHAAEVNAAVREALDVLDKALEQEGGCSRPSHASWKPRTILREVRARLTGKE